MNGSNIVADTSLLVNFFNGLEAAKKVLQGQYIWISVITEIELLSFGSLTKSQDKLIRSFLDQCILIELNKPIRELAIEIRKKHKLKVPDAIIASTSLHLDFPLITMDSDFNKIKNLNAIVLDVS